MERPTDDGTLPVDPLSGEILYSNGPGPETLSDTSDEVETEKEEEEVKLEHQPSRRAISAIEYEAQLKKEEEER